MDFVLLLRYQTENSEREMCRSAGVPLHNAVEHQLVSNFPACVLRHDVKIMYVQLCISASVLTPVI